MRISGGSGAFVGPVERLTLNRAPGSLGFVAQEPIAFPDAIPYRARPDGLPNLRRPWTSEDASGARSEAIMTPSRSSSTLPVARLDAAARLILRDPELARDAVQEALIRAWRDLPGSPRSGPVRRLAPPPDRQRLSRSRPRRRRRRPIEVELDTDRFPGAVRPVGRAGRPRARRCGASAPRSRPPRGRRHVLPARDAAARGGGFPGHPHRHGQVPAPLRALAAMRLSVTAEPDPAPVPSPREGRSHDRADLASTVSCPPSSRTCTWGRLPTIVDDVLAAATAGSGSGRPGPSQEGGFPWTSRLAPRPLPRLPWRQLGILALIALLLAAAIAVYVGTQAGHGAPRRSVRRRNGAIVFAAGGDIFVGDPVSGSSRAIVTGPEMDGNPLFSRDGTRVAFMRQVDAGSDLRFRPLRRERRRQRSEGRLRPSSTPTTRTSGRPTARTSSFTDTEFRLYRLDATGAAATDAARRTRLRASRRVPAARREADPVRTAGRGGYGVAGGSQAVGDEQRRLWKAGRWSRSRRERARDGDFGSVRYSPDGTHDRLSAGSGRRHRPAPYLRHERRRDRAPTASRARRVRGPRPISPGHQTANGSPSIGGT